MFNKKKIMNTKKQLILSLSAIVAVTLVLGVSITSFAWFSTKVETADGIDMTTDDVTNPTLNMWIYDTEDEAKTDDSEGTAAWRELKVESDDYKSTIPDPFVDGTETARYTLKNLQFGTVDNLVQVKDDNTIYLRFELTANTNISKYTLSFSRLTSDYITIYDSDGTQIVDQKYNNGDEKIMDKIKYILEGDADNSVEAQELLQLYYTTSTSKLAPSDTDFSNLKFETEVISSADITANTTETQYLYVKIVPNLLTFAQIAVYLNTHMPCGIMYRINMSLESNHIQKS